MKSIVFPYGIRFQEDGKITVFPVAEARIKSMHTASESLFSMFLIDSGATVSVVPAEDAEVLGIDIQKGIKIIVRGLGKTDFVGYQHTVLCEIETHTMKIPIVFIDNPATLRIFGRDGLFDKFLIIFDEEKKRTLFLDSKKRNAIDKLL